MKITITHTEKKLLTVEIWKDYPDPELVGAQICTDEADIDVELEPGQYLVVRGPDEQ